MIRLLSLVLLCSLLLIPIYIFYRLFKHVFDDVSSGFSSSAKTTRDACVIGKRQESSNRQIIPFATFEFNDGTRKELIILNGDYGLLQKGDTGTLRYNGRYYKGFDRNVNHSPTPQYSSTSNRAAAYNPQSFHNSQQSRKSQPGSQQSTHNTQPSQEKLELGLQRLSKAENDPDLLGLALTSLHGALEDYFRNWLSSNFSVPPSVREIVIDTRQTQWKGLLDLMQQYGDLKDSQRNYILRINRLRQNVGHGGRYTGTRFELEKYADFVRGFVTNDSSSTNTNQNNNLER